jgi:hypothetical protein
MSRFLGLSNDDVKTIGAAATTVGVLVALFTTPVRHWWRTPLLSLEYDPSTGGPHWDRVRINDDSFFLRVRIGNARGCDAAEDAQVLISDFHAWKLGLEGRALEWSGQRERQAEPVTTIRLSPGMQRHIDVLQITPTATKKANSLTSKDHEEAPDVDDGAYLARLCVHPKPWGDSHQIPVGEHTLKLTIAAANPDTVSYKMTIAYTGGLSAELKSGPTRVHRRGPSTLIKAGAKFVRAGFRPWTA